MLNIHIYMYICFYRVLVFDAATVSAAMGAATVC